MTMQSLFHWFLKSEKKIQMFFYYIKLGPCLYWLIWNSKIQKSFWLLSIFRKIIDIVSHSLFYILFLKHCTYYIHCISPKSALYLENTLKYPQTHWNTLKYIKTYYKCIEIYYKHIEIHHKYTIVHSNILCIHSNTP
jgi:hypothetical protein